MFDVKCTQRLAPAIEPAAPVMWKTGHSRMKEHEGALAGEMSGHIFFGERWYGFDDAMYITLARLLEILSRSSRPERRCSTRCSTSHSTPELNACAEASTTAGVQRLARAGRRFEGASEVIGPSTACAPSMPTASGCARTPRRCWCCVSRATAPAALQRNQGASDDGGAARGEARRHLRRGG